MESLEPRRLLAAPQLDITFGEGGIADLTGELANYGAFALVHELGDGKIIAVGGANAGVRQAIVVRLTSDGQPDTTFDGDGRYFPIAGEARDAVIAPDGRIFLIADNLDELLICRLNANGTLDTAFGADGVVSFSFSGADSVAASTIALQPDGKIVFTMLTTRVTQGHEVFLKRLNVDGTIDSTFRGGISQSNPLDLDEITDIAVQSDGKILLTGTSTTLDAPGAAVARFTADGAIDTTFGANGIQRISNEPENVLRPESLLVDPDGKILVTADFYSDAADTNALLERLNANGTPDTSFGGGDGMVRLGQGTSEPEPGPLIVAPDGKIIAVLNTFSPARGSVARFNANGTIDATFGEGGVVAPNSQKLDTGTALAFTAAGDLLLAGAALSVARFTDNPPDVFLSAQGHLFVNGTAAADTIALEHSGAQLIVHRNGVDTPFTFAAVTQFTASTGAGNDTVTVPFALDCSISGGDGNDSISLGDGKDTIDAGAGDDTVTTGSGDSAIKLGDGNNRCTTGAGNDSIDGGAGNDTIDSGAGDDRVYAFGGDDSVTCGIGNDYADSGYGRDTISGGAGDDLITAGYYLTVGDKLFDGGDGNDILIGGSGRDTLRGGAQKDAIDGGLGSDLISGGGGKDRLGGGAGRDHIHGGNGDDQIDGGSGDDHLWGDAGNDSILARTGHDIVEAGSGDDLIFSRDGTVDTIDGGAGSDSLVESDAAIDQFTNIETIALPV